MALSRLSFLAANPRDRHTPLRQLEELSRIRQAVDASPLKRRIDIGQYLTARIDDLVRILRFDRPEVLHYTGFHANEKGGILLEDADGFSDPVTPDEIVELFKEHKPGTRLVLLNTCFNDGTAERLAEVVDCVIGFEGLLADDFANRLAESFYPSVLSAKPVRAALEAAADAARKDAKAAADQKQIGHLDCERIFFRPGVDPEAFRAFTAKPLTVFISYGGPDGAVAERLDRSLEARGVETFLFAHDAKIGRPLHRMMHRAVNDYDWTVLLCSKNSLDRPGVLNEIEESLRKASRGGGHNPLAPIAIDDYVLEGWSPDRPDLATYIRDLVIGDFRKALDSDAAFDSAVDRLVQALEAPE
jgi:hypothetical protein